MALPILPQGGFQGYKIGLMMVPEENVALPITLDFSADAVRTVDIAKELQALKIPFPQMVYVDNSGDANKITFVFEGTLFAFVAKGNTQGIYPLILPSGIVRFTATQAAIGAILKPIILLSMPVAPIVWPTT